MEQEAIVLGYSGYDFKQDGEIVKGAKISYLTKDFVNQNLKEGFLPNQIAFDLDILQDNKIKFPCFAKLKFSIVPDNKNKPQLVCVGLEFLNSVDFKHLFDKPVLNPNVK